MRFRGPRIERHTYHGPSESDPVELWALIKQRNGPRLGGTHNREVVRGGEGSVGNLGGGIISIGAAIFL